MHGHSHHYFCLVSFISVWLRVPVFAAQRSEGLRACKPGSGLFVCLRVGLSCGLLAFPPSDRRSSDGVVVGILAGAGCELASHASAVPVEGCRLYV